MSFFYIVIMIGSLVFFHELGHFLVAKACGVKVERFSIGFGPKLFGFFWGETEYVIAALPLGGYVQMLGSEFSDMETVAEEDRERSLLAKPIWKRSLIVLAGPAFNILLPLVIFFGFGLSQTTAPPSMVGEVLADTPAERAGLQAGDRIVSIDHRPITYWHQMLDEFSGRPGEPLEVVWERQGTTLRATITPEQRTETHDPMGLMQSTRGRVGLLASTHGSTIGVASPGSPAGAAGLKNFDQIVSIDGVPVHRFDQVQAAVAGSQGKPLGVIALRPERIEGVKFGEFFARQLVQATVSPIKQQGQWDAGLIKAELILSEVVPGSPAASAGLQAGDRIVALEGKPVNSWLIFISTMHQAINLKLAARAQADETKALVLPFELTYVRDGQRITTTFTPEVTPYKDEFKQNAWNITMGWSNIYPHVQLDPIPFPLGARMVYAARLGAEETWEGVSMIGKLFGRIFQGKVNFSDQVGGPILVGELAAQAGKAGLDKFFRMMALLSINLAIFNLLPIPLLDGGRLLLYAIEAVKRGPLSFRVRQITAYVGFALIIMLMVMAFKNDIERNWDRIVDFLF